LLFTIVPLFELYLLFKIAKFTSWSSTFLLVISTGVIGAYMAKKEGKQIIIRIQNEIGVGRVPGEELINGLCVLIGGALLLTPGILTDILGFSLIIPFTRLMYKRRIKELLKNMINRGNVNIYYND
jgi:UPF0716 protein FxsA